MFIFKPLLFPFRLLRLPNFQKSPNIHFKSDIRGLTITTSPIPRKWLHSQKSNENQLQYYRQHINKDIGNNFIGLVPLRTNTKISGWIRNVPSAIRIIRKGKDYKVLKSSEKSDMNSEKLTIQENAEVKCPYTNWKPKVPVLLPDNSETNPNTGKMCAGDSNKCVHMKATLKIWFLNRAGDIDQIITMKPNIKNKKNDTEAKKSKNLYLPLPVADWDHDRSKD